MIPVAEAVQRITSAFKPVESETAPLAEAPHRVAAEDVRARMMQPPAPVSAMDGYAVRAEDAATVPVTLKVIGSSPAGHPFTGTIGKGEAVRIFTGGVVPEGGEAIVFQEDTDATATSATIKKAARPTRHIPAPGPDSKTGDALHDFY